MIVIKNIGGIGNQMFIYALYLSFKHLGKKVKMDNTKYFIPYYSRSSIKDIFNLDYGIVPNNFYDKLQEPNKYKRFFTYKYYGVNNIVYESNIKDKNIFDYSNAYLIGYWQSEKYFINDDVKKELRDTFKIPDNLITNDFNIMAGKIRNTNSVSIHFRRTDYIVPNNTIRYGNICTDKYYENAIDYINDKVDNSTFYVFSDDKEYVKQLYGDKQNYVIVNEDNSLNDIQELFLMSYCKHNILANSSYSWWAAWLNENDDVIKIVPNKWDNIEDKEEIYTTDMIRLGG